MALFVFPSFNLSNIGKSLGSPKLCGSKALLPFSSQRRVIWVKAKIVDGGAGSGFIEGDRLRIRLPEVDHNKVVNTITASSCTQTYEPKPFPPNMWSDDYIASLVTENQKTKVESEIHVEKLVGEVKEKFNSMEDGEISPSSYDTAWVARVPAIDGSHQPQFPETLNWIIDNQLRDGSWGEESVFLASDRILNTLACLITLTIWDTGKTNVHTGLDFIRRHARQMMKEILANGTLKVFETVFPPMLNEAKSLGLDIDANLFIEISERRDLNMKRISAERLHTMPTGVLYYLEGVQDVVDWKTILHLQSNDGSFLGSPASTACVFLHTGDTKCLQFLTNLLSKFRDHVPCMYPVDICERLRTVDYVERLGIDRYFQAEIKRALDYVFRYWDERGVGFGRESLVPDIDCTATGLRLLRLHGYNVSSDVLENISGDQLYEGGPSDMLSLYNCSQINFPEETLMREASVIAKASLSQFIQSNDISHELALRQGLRGEIEHALDYPWQMNLPRLMARNYMDKFKSSPMWMEKTIYQLPNVTDKRFVQLAKLDFNGVQALHQMEIVEINRWYKDCGFNKLTFNRHRPVEIYFTAAVVMFEPEYSACRIAYTKAACIAVILDDLFDSHSSVDQVNLFTELVKRWDLSLLHCLPAHMKICYLGLYKTVNELGQQALEAQGRDVHPYLRSVWEELLSATAKEAEWADAKYVPSLKEYLENGKVSVALATLILNSIFFTGERLPESFLCQLDFRAPFLHLVCLTARLMNDARTFSDERDRGEVASCVECYRGEYPGCTEEEALTHLFRCNQDSFVQLNYEFLKPEMLPYCLRKLLFDTARAAQLFYRNKDGFGMSAQEMEEYITKFLFQSIV